MKDQHPAAGLKLRFVTAVRTFIKNHIVADDPYDSEDIVTTLERERTERYADTED